MDFLERKINSVDKLLDEAVKDWKKAFHLGDHQELDNCCEVFKSLTDEAKRLENAMIAELDRKL